MIPHHFLQYKKKRFNKNIFSKVLIPETINKNGGG